MKNTHLGYRRFFKGATLLASTAVLATVMIGAPGTATAQTASPLTITNEPLPPELRSQIYSKPRVAPRINAAQVTGSYYYNDSTPTVAGRKIDSLQQELGSLQGQVHALSRQLSTLETDGQRHAAEYYASVATISTQLQSGTTPGNPRLVRRLNTARDNLERLSQNVARLNDLAVQISQVASMSSFLLESARATYSLSGAVEEDHVRLAQLEDSINSTVVVIDRLLNNVNDDINRTSAYMNTERDNLRTMATAISTGSLLGKSLSNRPFSRAQRASFTPDSASGYGDSRAQMAPEPLGRPTSPRPLVKIRFDRPDVAYQQPVYMAVNEALNRYPDARFELVAVHPSVGNAAQIAIESTRSRRNAERVLRSLSEMGLDLDRIDLSYSPSEDATTNEVHLYVR